MGTELATSGSAARRLTDCANGPDITVLVRVQQQSDRRGGVLLIREISWNSRNQPLFFFFFFFFFFVPTKSTLLIDDISRNSAYFYIFIDELQSSAPVNFVGRFLCLFCQISKNLGI